MKRELKQTLKVKLKRYRGNLNKKYLYKDLDNDLLGINYNSFLKLRYETFNKNHILKNFSLDGWRILCYLISKAKDYKYILITPNIILKELNIKNKTVIYNALNCLFANDIIIGNINYKEYNNKNKVKGANDIIEVLITYTDNEYYPYKPEIQGFRPIPLDLVSYMVKHLNSEEWAVYCYLLIRYRYFCVNNVIDNDTGEINYYMNEYFYAFPSQEDISKILGCERKKINKITESLERKGYITLKKPIGELKLPKIKNINGEKKIVRTCIQYRIKLMERVEYIYNYILSIEDNEQEKIAKAIGIGNYIKKSLDEGKIDNITNKLFLLNSSIYPEINEYIKSKVTCS